MNLADLTSALTQKDSEKATVIAEIDKVKVSFCSLASFPRLPFYLSLPASLLL